MAENQLTHAGGANDADNSGTMRYVVIKHGGRDMGEISPGVTKGFTGLSLTGVGSGTSIQNIEVYAHDDDGLYFEGGSVNVENAVVLYAEDDIVDVHGGYN